ncbi:hypothetical protein [Sphingomonas sp. C3-2]|uniref:hypothetical protein n=1 Tax=Sphingomonas sp. C3-2 TaxID=3062169 RepID=UPI00294AA733|nr:hypothetical protein [Sphingomonas sp. C3-2]WOK35839.1 hypothetical protein QYC26_12600 [Sphingomonas sp. C3-2]
MILIPYLLLAAASAPPSTMPPITLVCRRDNAGHCLPVGLSPPAQLLREEHDRAAAIYEPYWVCYWQALKTHKDFGTSDAQRAKKTMSSAVDACASSKASADSNMDTFLRPLEIYGDDTHKRFIRDYFRSSAGDIFLDKRAFAAGQHDAYIRTHEAYQKFLLGQIENALNQTSRHKADKD